MKVKVKRIIATLMLLLVIINALPMNAFAAFITDINSDAEFGVIDGSLAELNHEMHYAKYDGETYLLFCTEYGQTSPTGQSYQYGNDFLAEFKANRPEFERIAEMIYFGYAMDYGMGLPGSYESKVAATCTQQYVWEQLGNAPGRDSWNANYMSSGKYAEWLSKTEGYYNQYHGNTSFNGTTNKVTIGQSITITDSNGKLSTYLAFSQNVNGVVFEHTQGSNDLIVTAEESCSAENVTFNTRDYGLYQLMPNGTSYNSGTMSNYVHFKFTSGAVQNLMFSNYIDSSTFSLTINIEVEGKIQFKKVNENGDGLGGVEFELYADEDIKDSTGEITYYTKDQKICSVITDQSGFVSIEHLKLGRYYLKEFAPKNGYLRDNKKYTFSIDRKAGSKKIDLGEIVNYEPSGKITVTKTNKNGDKVPNSKFLVTAAEDIVNKEGTVTYFHTGDEVGTIENTSSGTGTLENLHLGKYIVTEIYASTGYLLNSESKEVELKYADENTAVVFDSTTIINDEPTGTLDVKKLDVLTGNGVRPDGTYHHGDATFSGAVYTLYASENITNYAKTVTYYNKDDEIAKFTFDASGTPTVKILNNADGVSLSISGSKLKGLPMGNYYLRETELPKSGYLPDKTTYNFAINYVDQNTADINVSQNVSEQVERAKFELIKVSTDMNQVAPVVDKAQFTAILEKYVKYYGSFDEAYEHRNEFAEDE